MAHDSSNFRFRFYKRGIKHVYKLYVNNERTREGRSRTLLENQKNFFHPVKEEKRKRSVESIIVMSRLNVAKEEIGRKWIKISLRDYEEYPNLYPNGESLSIDL